MERTTLNYRIADYVFLSRRKRYHHLDNLYKETEIVFRYPDRDHQNVSFPLNIDMFCFASDYNVSYIPYVLAPNGLKYYGYSFLLTSLPFLDDFTISFYSRLDKPSLFKSAFTFISSSYLNFTRDHSDAGLKILQNFIFMIGRQLVYEIPLPLPALLDVSFTLRLSSRMEFFSFSPWVPFQIHEFLIDSLSPLLVDEDKESPFSAISQKISISLPKYASVDTPYIERYLDLFTTLDVKSIIFVWFSLLTESKVVFLSKNILLLLNVCEAFISLLYPFRWHHAYIPYLPRPLYDILDAPLPIVVGLCETNPSKVSLSDGVLVDLNQGRIVKSTHSTIPQGPSHEVNLLYKNLMRTRKMLCRSSIEILGVRQIFTDTICSILFGFDNHILYIDKDLVVLNESDFLKSRKDDLEFYYALCNTNMFRGFCDTLQTLWMSSFLQSYANFKKIIEKVITQYHRQKSTIHRESKQIMKRRGVFPYQVDVYHEWVETRPLSQPFLLLSPRLEESKASALLDIDNLAEPIPSINEVAQITSLSIEEIRKGLKESSLSLSEYAELVHEIALEEQRVSFSSESHSITGVKTTSSTVRRTRQDSTISVTHRIKNTRERSSSVGSMSIHVKQLYGNISSKAFTELLHQAVISSFLEEALPQHIINDVFIAFASSPIARENFLNILQQPRLVSFEEQGFGVILMLCKFLLDSCSQSNDFKAAKRLLIVCKHITRTSISYRHTQLEGRSPLCKRYFLQRRVIVDRLESRIIDEESAIWSSTEFWKFFYQDDIAKEEISFDGVGGRKEEVNLEKGESRRFEVVASILNRMRRLKVPKVKTKAYLSEIYLVANVNKENRKVLMMLLDNLYQAEELS